MPNFGVASSIWCKMSDIKVDTQHNEPLMKKLDSTDKKGSDYANVVARKLSKSFKGMPQNAVFCPVYQQQASHNFNVYTDEGQFSSEFINYLKKYDSLLFYGSEGMGCTTIFKKLCNYVLNNEIFSGKKYLPVYIYANWLFREIKENKNNYRIDKYIDIVLNDWLDDPYNEYKVSELCKKNPILIIIDDLNDDTDDAIFKWICENISRKDIKIFISTNNSRIRTKFEKIFASNLEGKVQYASIFLPLTNASQQGQNIKAIEPSLSELLGMTPYFKHMLSCCQKRDRVASINEISSVTALINEYIGDDIISEEGKRCAIEIFEGRQKELKPNESILSEGLIHKEGKIYEFENKILYYYFLARQWFETLIVDKGKSTIESSMLSIKTKAATTSGAELVHKYFISLSLDGLSQTLHLKDEEKPQIINFYKEELPLILAESLRWIRYGNELYWKIGLKGLLNIINSPEKHSEVDVIEAERMLYQLGIGIEKKSDRPFLHYEEIPSNSNTLKFLLPKEDFWFKLSTKDETIDVARFPVTVGEFSFFLESGYFCAREQCVAQETFSENDAKAAWDKIWGKNEYDIKLVAQLMQKKWGLIHEKLNNNDIIIQLCNLFSDDKQIKQLYLFKELYDKNEIVTTGQSIREGLDTIYSIDKLKHPMKWGDPLYSNPYYPIIGINYYEARAYCRWLSLMSQKKGEYEYRLLTRDEWREMVRGIVPKKEDIICNKDNQDDYLRIAFLGSLRNLNEDLKPKTDINSTDAYGNIFELVDTRFSKIKYGDDNMAHVYCFGGSYLQNYELVYNIRAKGPYEGQASSFQRNIDIGFRICRIKRKG